MTTTIKPKQGGNKASDSVQAFPKITDPVLGPFPSDWHLRKLSEVAQLRTGPFGTLLHKSDYVRDGVPLVNPIHIINGNIVPDDCTTITRDAACRLADFRLVVGDVIAARRGELGRSAVVGDREHSWICGTGSMIIRPRDGIMSMFLQHVFCSPEVVGRVIDASVGSTMASLNHSTLSNLVIQCPPVAEQHAIAEALSDVDGLIGALGMLIAKKRAIKQAAMQQLLTGKTRLPGFKGKWETKWLADIGSFSKGHGIRRDDVSDEGVPCVRYGELYTKYDNYIIALVSHIPVGVARAALPIKAGDLLFAGSGETAEEIGRCAAYIAEEPAYAGGDIVVLSPHGQNSMYLGHLMNHQSTAKQKARFGQGDAVVHISARNLAQVEVSLPPIEEQTAIAAVLSDMDAEIAALERRRDKTKQIKQGMMQELLTGRIRLVQPDAKFVPITPGKAESSRSQGKAPNWQIEQAAVIGVLAKTFGTEEYPLPRKRRVKLTYLLERHVKGKAEGYLKKAAGPYNPATKYRGPEGIALKNGYVREHHNGTYPGLVAGDKVAQAESYLVKWFGADALAWLEQFRFVKTEELELLATVDMAVEELRAAGGNVDMAGVKDVIRGQPEWLAKLDRQVFSDAGIARAIETSRKLFG